MSEDRLKAVKEIVKRIDSMESNPWKDSERGRLKESLFDSGHVDWLIKQVIIERAKYEVVTKIKNHQVRQKDLAHEKNEELEHQNKRYCEAIKKAMNELVTPGMTKTNVYRTLNFALESE